MQYTFGLPVLNSRIGIHATAERYLLCYAVSPNWHYELRSFDPDLAPGDTLRFKLGGSVKETYFSASPLPVIVDGQPRFLIATAINKIFSGLQSVDASNPAEAKQVALLTKPLSKDNKDITFAAASFCQGVLFASTFSWTSFATGFAIDFWNPIALREGGEDARAIRYFVKMPNSLKYMFVGNVQAIGIEANDSSSEGVLILSWTGAAVRKDTEKNVEGIHIFEIPLVFGIDGIELGEATWSMIAENADNKSYWFNNNTLNTGSDGLVRILTMKSEKCSRKGDTICSSPRLFIREAANQWKPLGAPLGDFIKDSAKAADFNYAILKKGPDATAEPQMILSAQYDFQTRAATVQLNSLSGSWKQLPGTHTLAHIATGRDGDTWAIEAQSRSIVTFDYLDNKWRSGLSTPAGAVAEELVLNEAGLAWLRTSEGKLYRSNPGMNPTWKPIKTSSPVTSISAGPGRSLWTVIDDRVNLFTEGNSPQWVSLPEIKDRQSTQAGGPNIEECISLTNQGDVWTYDGSVWNQVPLTHRMETIAAGSDRQIYWGVTENRDLIDFTLDGCSQTVIEPPSEVISDVSIGSIDSIRAISNNGHAFVRVNIVRPDIDDMSNWMSRVPNMFTRKLSQVCFPATHDSATFVVTPDVSDAADIDFLKKLAALRKYLKKYHVNGTFDRVVKEIAQSFAKTQSHNVDQQLANGIRWLDLRPAYWAKKRLFMNQHSFYVSEMESILKSIANFLRNTERELLIVMTGDFDPALRKHQGTSDRLVELITRYLGDRLVCSQSENGKLLTSIDLMNKTVGELTRRAANDPRQESKVIFFYNNDLIGSNKNFFNNKYKYYDGKWSNTMDFDRLKNDQLKFLKKPLNNSLMALSWTLTLNLDDVWDATWKAIVKGDKPPVTVLRMSKLTNPHLGQFLSKIEAGESQVRINRIDTDYYHTSEVVDKCIRITRQGGVLHPVNFIRQEAVTESMDANLKETVSNSV